MNGRQKLAIMKMRAKVKVREELAKHAEGMDGLAPVEVGARKSLAEEQAVKGGLDANTPTRI